jgi:hypothetical protein
MRLYLMKMKPMSNQGIQNWSRALRPKLTKWVFKGSIGVDLDLKDTESFKRFEEWLYKHVGNIMVQIREQDKKQLDTGKVVPIYKKIGQVDLRYYKTIGALWKDTNVFRKGWFRATHPSEDLRRPSFITRDVDDVLLHKKDGKNLREK